MNDQKHRLFFALYPVLKERKCLHATVTPLLDSVVGRPVGIANLHLTLMFIGSVNSSELLSIQQCLPDALHFSAFQMSFNFMDYWRNPKILWVGCRQPPEKLFQLADFIQMKIGKHCNMEREHRPYKPHVTVCRKVKGFGSPVYFDAVTWHINRVHLMRSESTGQGVRYRSMMSWPLQ